MTQDEKIDKLVDVVGSLDDKFRELTNEIEKKALKDENEKLKNAKTEPWWSTAVKFVGLPAALVVLFLNFKQTGNVSTDTDLKKAQIEKTKLETLEKRLGILTDSVSVQKIENAEDRIILKKDVSDIANLLTEIKEIKSSNNTNTLISRFILIYLFFVGAGLFIRIFSFLWHNFFNSAFRFLSDKWRNMRWDSDNDKLRKKYQKRVKYLDWAQLLVNAIPTIISLTLDFLVITIVVIPLFNLTSSDLNSTGTFQSIFNSIKHFDFAEGVRKLKEIIF